ncbi:MAG: pyruvate kinase [Gammaproteobacteria bacterium]|nr:pyruvate kinase [Gammaproteobacteria bacterium]
MLRRTKIVATLGPASSSAEVLREMIIAGMDVVRLNFSHGTAEDHIRRAGLVRQCAAEAGRPVGILVDLQGPKIRITKFANGAIFLKEGDTFTLDALLGDMEGSQESVGITYKELVSDVKQGDYLLLDDGRLELRVTEISGSKIVTSVVLGGELSNNKGINLRGGGLSAPTITEKDIQDILIAAQIDADYLAISFPRSAEDVIRARQLLRDAGGHGHIVAKIERFEALDVIEQIIDASDGIMIARGDLGVEIGDAELPAVQKRLIKMAQERNCVVITATQMMESMIQNPIPTRAEVFDVANAVLDGTDAVMLSAETAAGKHPIKVIKAMARITSRAEKEPEMTTSTHRINTKFERIDEAIAMSTMYCANHLKVKAIAALTESGRTVLVMSRIHSSIPIYALTQHDYTIGRTCLFRGVIPMRIDQKMTDHISANMWIVNKLRELDVVESGDRVIITKGDLLGAMGGTNAMKVVEVGNMPIPSTSSELDA